MLFTLRRQPFAPDEEDTSSSEDEDSDVSSDVSSGSSADEDDSDASADESFQNRIWFSGSGEDSYGAFQLGGTADLKTGTGIAMKQYLDGHESSDWLGISTPFGMEIPYPLPRAVGLHFNSFPALCAAEAAHRGTRFARFQKTSAILGFCDSLIVFTPQRVRCEYSPDPQLSIESSSRMRVWSQPEVGALTGILGYPNPLAAVQMHILLDACPSPRGVLPFPSNPEGRPARSCDIRPLFFPSFSSCFPRGQRRPSLVLPPDLSISDGLVVSTPIKTLSVPNIECCAAGIGIENVQYIGSYNWTNDKEPTMIVPGSPREWTNCQLPFTLHPDNGLRFVDENRHRMPDSPLHPLFMAADAVDAAVDWRHVDIVTDCNVLLKLAHWVDKGAEARDFRIDVELAGERTLLMNRWEPNTRDHAGNGYSFGFGYEEATTKHLRGCEGSTGHYRIIKYDFYHLSMVVRHQVDACLPPVVPAGAEGGGHGGPGPRASTTPGPGSTVDNLSTALASAPTPPAHILTTTTNTLKIIHTGREVPQSSIIELTSRSQRYIHKIDCTNLFSQLYLSQTPLLYTGVHQRGEFRELRKRVVAEDPQMEEQCEAAKGMLRQLGQVLREIQKLTVTHPEKRLSLVCEAGMLTVYERAATKSCLPETLMERFSTV
ncbi:hypothetical protein EVG20_g6556 [Dentipellis fragilis]|uniref:Uncharacterized protein n=1 Tax=Dentipellis fragilis TaxID=205917 RepID=A0A4Y9YLK5_9AGAM|nr:hypothetical protein EVG20_g6556 [Dentipellis fragilis]